MKPSAKRVVFAVVVVCAVLFASLLSIEAGMRLFSKRLEKDSAVPTPVSLFDFGNILEKKLILMMQRYPAKHDPVLGWIPRPGYSGSNNVYGTQITISPDSLRSNGRKAPNTAPRVLAVGDSFTFGDAVSDHETWPAFLEEIIGKPVANGGVFGYGFDQIYLRAQVLADKTAPGLILVGLIPDDIPRMGFSKWYGAERPYFNAVDGRLELKNQPVPDLPVMVDNLGFVKSVLGHFYAVDYFMRRSGASEWWYAKKYKSVRVENDLAAVSRLIVDGLYNLAMRRGCRVALVVQYTEDDLKDPEKVNRKRVYPVIVHARERGIPVVDFYPLLKAQLPEVLHSYFRGHMTPDGNRFTARMVAAGLAAEGVVSRAPYLEPDLAFYQQASSQYADEMDKLARAKDHFLQEIAADPQNPGKYNTVGVLYLNLGDFASAALNFTKAITLNPRNGEAANNLGMVAMMTKHYADAEGFFQKAIAIDPKLFAAYYNMACARSLQGDADGSVAWLEKAVAAGFKRREMMEKDPDLDTARKSGGFAKVLESIPK